MSSAAEEAHQPVSKAKLDGTRDAMADEQFRGELVRIIPQLRAFARGLCSGREIADDMVQDALTRAWAARKSFEAGSNFRAWIFMILRNRYYTTVRKQSRMVPWDPEAAERILVAQPNQEWHAELQAVSEALQKISPEQREVLMLVGANGLSYEETAEIAGCAIGTIKSRLARGRIALKALLEGEDLPAEEADTPPRRRVSRPKPARRTGRRLPTQAKEALEG